MSEKLKFLYGDRYTWDVDTITSQVGHDIEMEDRYGSGWQDDTTNNRGALTSAEADSAGTYTFVAPNGNDSTGAGTLANPYLTIQKAIDVILTAGSGNDIFVFRNSYVGDMIFDECLDSYINNGTQTIRITVEKDEVVYLKPSDVSSLNVHFLLGLELEYSVFVESGSTLYVIGYDSSDITTYKTTDGYTWVAGVSSADLAGTWVRNAVSFTDSGSNADVYASYSGGVLKIDTSANTWANLAAGAYYVGWVEVFGDYLYYCTYGGGTASGNIYRTSDGSSFSLVFSEPTDANAYSMAVYGNYLYVCTTAGIYRTNDGENYAKVDSDITTGDKMYAASDRIYVYNSTTIWESTDGITWNEINATFTALKWLTTIDDNDDYIYVNAYNGTQGIGRYNKSFSSVEVELAGVSNAVWQIYYYNGCLLYSETDGNSIKGVQLSQVHTIESHTLSLDGFELDGNSVTAFGLTRFDGNAQIGYSTIKNSLTSLIENVDLYSASVDSGKGLILSNSKYGMRATGSSDRIVSNYCVFNDFYNYGIYISDCTTANTSFNNSTFYNCTNSIYNTDTSLTGITITDCIFYKNSSYDIYSVVAWTLTYSVYNGSTYNITVGSTNTTGDPLFYDYSDDFRIKTVYKADSDGNLFKFSSPAYTNGTGGIDSGAYQEVYAVTDNGYSSYEVDYNPQFKTHSALPVNFSDFVALNGNIYQYKDKHTKDVTLIWHDDSESTMPQWYNLRNLLDRTDYIRMLPNGDTGWESGSYTVSITDGIGTLQKSGESWVTDQWEGFFVKVTDGSDYYYYVTSNNSDTLTVTDPDLNGQTHSGTLTCVIVGWDVVLDDSEGLQSPETNWTGYSAGDNFTTSTPTGMGLLTGYQIKTKEYNHE